MCFLLRFGSKTGGPNSGATRGAASWGAAEALPPPWAPTGRGTWCRRGAGVPPQGPWSSPWPLDTLVSGGGGQCYKFVIMHPRPPGRHIGIDG